MEQLIDFLIVVLPPLITAAGGIIMGRRMRQAEAVKTEAEAERIMAEARRVLAEAESDEVRSMGQVMEAWKTLLNATNVELTEIRKEMGALRREYNQVLVTLREYKDGAAILISQIKRLGYRPEWSPSEENERDGE